LILIAIEHNNWPYIQRGFSAVNCQREKNGYKKPHPSVSMGSCICHPLFDVTDDPSVLVHPSVAGTVMVHTIHGNNFSRNYNILLNVLMYVKNDQPYYEDIDTCGDCLCRTCKISRYTWKLSKHKEVNVITRESVTVEKGDSIDRPKANAWSFELLLNPGVRITTEPFRITLVAAMRDAGDFGLCLYTYISGRKQVATDPSKHLLLTWEQTLGDAAVHH